MRIGIDAGGTFTDFVVLRKGSRLQTFKIRSNPAAPYEVILEGLRRAAASSADEVIHGSTVATNALLERKGARTAFLTTAGFEDLLEIGRQNRDRLYDLTPPPRRLLINPADCHGVSERTFADGMIETKPVPAAIRRLGTKLKRSGIWSISICFLHAWRNPENEQTVAQALSEALGPDIYLSVSSEVCPEFREFERAATTAVNAYVGPLMKNYLDRLSGQNIAIMQSNGGAMSLSEAGSHAVRTILSGPAGGAIGAAAVARSSGFPKILAFDMGGTSTDVSLCENQVREVSEAWVDGLPLHVPMLEIHTVGAGGGSLAKVDAGGLLRVGPDSAGADPGPACYGKGTEATVTDAHVFMGRIGSHQFLGGEMPIHPRRSASAIQRLAEQLSIKPVQVAAGIIRVANAGIERAIRVVSVERGYDPRDFALLAFGGCGALHSCDIASELGISTVLVPEHAGVLSALGMLLAPRIRDYSASVLGRDDYDAVFAALEQNAREDTPGAKLSHSADLRYSGQSYELTVPWTSASRTAFHKAHQRLYGYANSQRAVEVVTLRVRATKIVTRPRLNPSRISGGAPESARRVHVNGQWREIPVLHRGSVPKRALHGPALVLDYGATTLVNAGWSVRCDATGMLVLTR